MIVIKRIINGRLALLRLALCLSSLFWGCSFVAEKPYEECPYYSDTEPGSVKGLTSAQDYAGEVLAYMLQVVVGNAGPPENRPAWRTAGIATDLDLKTIAIRLSDPEYKKTNLFVLDANLMGLSDVLYHYNPRLNQFKGRYVFDSLYPSPELLAIRLLILQKLQNGETVSFSDLLKRESLLCSDAVAPEAADLEAINLTLEEFRLLKDVFLSEPIFFQYYKHPFIVESLVRIGFYRKDAFTEEVIQRASYQKYARKASFIPWKRKLNIAIVSSLTGEFEFGDAYKEHFVYGFKPTQTFMDMTDALISKISVRAAELVQAELLNQGAANTANETFWEMLWEQRFLPLIAFEVYDQRPFSIYPQIEIRALDNLCPDADLRIVVLGKEVYRSIHFDPNRKDLKDSKRLYIDIEDIRYLYADEKIDAIARFIADWLISRTPNPSGLSDWPAMPPLPESVTPGPG